MAGIDQYTKLLLHMDTDNYEDQSENNHSFNLNGNAFYDTSTKKFGTSSLYLDGTGDYIDVPDSEDWNYGTGDFTIDFWVMFDSGSRTVRRNIITQSYNDNNNVYCYWHISDGLSFTVIDGGAYTVSSHTGTSGWSDSTWYHIAIVRNGSSWKIYRNGTSVASATASITVPNITAPLKIGSGITYSGQYYDFKGYIDEVRISKGIARWTENFTPPIVPYGIVYRISGNLTESARIIVINESDDTIEYNGEFSAGNYEIELEDTNYKTVIARKSDGEVVGFGKVTPQ